MRRNRHQALITETNRELKVLSQDWPANTKAIQAVHNLTDNFLLSNGGYQGYNTRAWRTFTRLPRWYDIVQALHKTDSAFMSQQYWSLLAELERGIDSPRFYAGSAELFSPTDAEQKHCKRIYDRYCVNLGIDDKEVD